jgi:hypothetical protein
MRILCWIILLIGAPYCAAAQSAVQINEEPLVTNLIKNWTQANRNNPRVSGWRVQILSTNDRAQADATRNQFRTQYPELPGTRWCLQDTHRSHAPHQRDQCIVPRLFSSTRPQYPSTRFFTLTKHYRG